MSIESIIRQNLDGHRNKVANDSPILKTIRDIVNAPTPPEEKPIDPPNVDDGEGKK